MRAGDTGFVWGALGLHNTTGADIVLDDVRPLKIVGGVAASAAPYVWSNERAKLDLGALVAGWQTPTPASWETVHKYPLPGYVLHPESRAAQAEDSDIGSEVMLSFGLPTGRVTVMGFRIAYHIGGHHYVKIVSDSQITVCPAGVFPCDIPDDPG